MAAANKTSRLKATIYRRYLRRDPMRILKNLYGSVQGEKKARMLTS
jgi:hypothetical protein